MKKVKKVILIVFVAVFTLSSCNYKYLKYNSNLSGLNINIEPFKEMISNKDKISKDEALDIVKKKLEPNEGRLIFEIGEPERIGALQYYPVHAYYICDNMSFTSGWYYVDVNSRKIYEAYAGLTELLVPIDKVEFILENPDQNSISKINALGIISKIITDNQYPMYYSLVKRDGRKYYLVATYDKSKDNSHNINPSAYQFYFIDSNTQEIAKWDVVNDKLILVDPKIKP